MREIENAGVSHGISKLMMMENAGHSIADEAMKILSRKRNNRHVRRRNVALVAGTGNNGGDVFVAARHLSYCRRIGIVVNLFLIGKEDDIKTEEALVNWKILGNTRPALKVHFVESETRVHILNRMLNDTDLIIVGIFGTGFHGQPRPVQKSVIDAINQNSGATVMSVDVPSGMEADSGEFQTAVFSDITVTMHAPKVGMLASPRSRKTCGKIVVANIGLPG